MPTLAAIDGGTYYHNRTLNEAPFARYFDERIYVRDLPFARLEDFDAVFVPCRLNAHLIAPLAPQLIAFWRGGGTLVAMGETFQDGWLPDVRMTAVETNFWWWLEEGADLGVRLADREHDLFRYIDQGAATWHLHGWFTLTENQTSLIETREGRCLLFEDRESHAPGRLIATTLDPCYHHGSHFMPATTRFLSGFLSWLKGHSPGGGECLADASDNRVDTREARKM